MKAMMVPAALLMRYFSDLKPKALPYSILANVPLSEDYEEGHGMMWPIDFPLPQPNMTFAQKFNAPYDHEVTNRLKLDSDKTYIEFMQVLRLFCFLQLQEY